MMYLVALLFYLAVSSARDFRENLDRAMENPDLFGGDMLGIDFTDRNVIPHISMRWTDKTIPYELDAAINEEPWVGLIASAMDEYEKNTCIRFKKRTTEENYVRIFQGQGCYSNVGMVGKGQQPLSLGIGCMYKGTIIHELGHAVGFYHEQNRSDRDKYLIIYWENIREGMENQFFLLEDHQNILMNKFDHESIMLYGNYVFSKDRKLKTMEAKSGHLLEEPYNKKGLSKSDIQRVNKMYNC